MPRRVGSADFGLALIQSGSTREILILATQDGLCGRLLHCQGKSEEKNDGLVEGALYQGHIEKRGKEEK